MRRTIDYGERGHVTVDRDVKAIAALAVEDFALAYLRAEGQRRPALVALSGGSTPKQMYEFFKHPLFKRRIVWDRMQLFWGDERWVPIDHDESNAGAARRGFIDEIGLDEEHWHPWPTHLDDPNQAATAYETSIRIVANEFDSTPVFDLVYLGMGDDGHTASLFPGTEAVHEQERLAIAHEVPKLDATRLTMTPKVINNAKEVLFLVAGAGKAEMLHRVLDGPVDVDSMPSQAIRPENGRLRWFVDEAAAARLERKK
ncbi:MAG: 6-phosphogluconolactonase [Chloroflexia bacterium]|jgi:6-phosphogluconolactonase|nr:6-phosphogluconolactonase [Chloroflexia bacterium]